MVSIKQDLIDLSDEVWRRLRGRVDDLSDAEYLWEPAPGCWTIRPGDRLGWPHDAAAPRPDPEPFTTIAWRMWHLIDLYGEDRAPRWLGVPPQGAPIGLDDPDGAPPPTATEAVALLERAHDRWDAHMAAVSEEALAEEAGDVAGGYARSSRAAYVLHMLDEFIHHGAEVSLLRDLWRWQHPLGVDPDVERAMRGDLTLADEIEATPSDIARELMRVAAAYARWPLVAALVDAGVPVPTDGQTPLHFAAGAGQLELVELLVRHGADETARDPQFDVPPVEWARFLDQSHVVSWFEARGA